MARPRVVIIGAGFGGLSCAKKLAGRRVDVLLIDRNNYHLFTPLLYQVASSLLNPSDIAQPVRSMFRGSRNVRVLRAEVTGIDFDRKAVRTADGGEHAYDRLVIAAGSTTNYFGLESVERTALGLKDLPEALELRNHILSALEQATQAGEEEAARWLTFVVVGGGPTGVEYAGALAELVRAVLPNEYPELAARTVRIVLVEGLDEVLPTFPGDLGREARRALAGRGIDVVTGVRVMDVGDGGSIVLSNGRELRAGTLVWAAGVKPAGLAEALDVPRSRSGRVEVDEYLRVKGRDGVYAIGDIASVIDDGREVPMLSAPAMQEGRHVARAIIDELEGGLPRPFRYRERGSMATIGRNAAVAELRGLHLKGFIGWLTWLVVHLYYLIGFRNRLTVLLGWAWNYIRFDRPVRIIARARGERGRG